MKKNFRWFLFYCFIAGLIMTVVGVSFDMIYRNGYKPIMKKWRAKKETELPVYLKEKDFFADHDFFNGNFTEPKSLQALLTESAQLSSLVTVAEKKAVLALKDNWIIKRFRMPKKENTAKLFNALEKFAVLSTAPPQSVKTVDTMKAPKTSRITGITKTEKSPMPQLHPFDFVIFSQIHMAQEIQKDPKLFDQILKEVVQLSQRLIRSEFFDDKLAALSILEKAHQFKDYYENRKPQGKNGANDGGAPLLPMDIINRYRLFLFQTYDYLDFLVGEELMNRVFLTNNLPSGFCAIFHKKQSLMAASAKFLSRRIPFEPNFLNEVLSWTKIHALATENCQTVAAPATVQLGQSLPTRIPFLRGLFALAHMIRNKSLSGK